jgi:outer membrane protein
MKCFRVFILVICTATVAAGQTNTMPVQDVSLEDCIQQALEHNLDLEIERYNPQISLYSVSASQGGYDPTFSLRGTRNYSESPGNSFDPVTGTPALGSTAYRNNFESGLGGLLPWGLNYNFYGTVGDNYGTTLGTNSFRNSSGTMGVTLTQPLLKNFWIDSTRLSIRVAKINLKRTEQGLRGAIISTVTAVENAYYDLIAARENVKVRVQALELADRLLAENKKRVEVGALAPLDEKQAASQVATAQADLLAAKQALASQQNALKSLLTDDYVNRHDINLAPTETLAAPVEVFNLQDSWSKGMELRPDLLQAKLDLESQGVQVKYNYNQLFPQLDAIGSYGYNSGGAGVRYMNESFQGLSDRNYANYSYGGVLSFPLSNRQARNNYKSSKASLEQILLSVKRLEQNILVEIDNAVIAAKSSYERVDATRAAREYAQAALEAEQKKLESGKSTSFVVLQLQRDLTQAYSQEIAALAEYNKALANLAQSEGTTLERRNIDVNVH